MRFHTPLAILLSTACGPDVKPARDTAGDSIYVGSATCHYDFDNGPRRMQAGVNNQIELKLEGPYPGYNSPVGYDRVGEPYPEFRILTLMVAVDEDRRVPSAPREAPTLEGWTEEVVRDLPDDAYFRLAFDVTPPSPGSWALYTRAEIPGVTDFAGLCYFLTDPAWEPDPPVEGWTPHRMIWIEAE
jgi:hypothetical protein